MGLGILFGKRFLLLEHTGRSSGLLRRAVLEVIRFDSTNRNYYVVSAFGNRADWFQNICKTPEVRIQVGWRWQESVAEPLDTDESKVEILDYAGRYPKTFKVLVDFSGHIFSCRSGRGSVNWGVLV